MEDKTKDKKERTYGFKPGKSGNPNGRPPGSSKPISSLRSTLNKLKDLEPDAVANISAIVRGQKLETEDGEMTEVDKTRLETSKWVITTISALSRAASAEEELKFKIKTNNEEKLEGKKEATTGNVIDGRARFSTEFVPDEEDA